MNKAQSTTEQLAESLKRLMNRMPFEKITIKNITDEAGLMRPTFYNHFRDKYDVVEWIFRKESVEPTYVLLENDMNQQALQLMMTNIAKNRDFYKKAIRIEGQNNFYEIMNRVFEELLEGLYEKKMKGQVGDNPLMTPKKVAGFFANSLSYVVKQWIESGDEVTIQNMMSLYDEVINHSLGDFL